MISFFFKDSSANDRQERELIAFYLSRVDNILMQYHGKMKIFLEQVLLLCEVSFRRAEGYVCAKFITGLQCCAVLGEGSPICVWNPTPYLNFSPLNLAVGMGLVSMNFHSTLLFPSCPHQYFFLITLVLSSSLISKHGRLAHCERNFSTLSHYLFLVLGNISRSLDL